MSRQSYKEYLEEYYKYFNSFSDVIDYHDTDDTDDKEKDHELARKEDDDFASDGEKIEPKKRGIRKSPYYRGREELNPRRFRQWMELSIAGD